MHLPELRIRRAGVDDVETIVQFNQALARETEDRQLEAERLQAGVQRALQLGDVMYFVAERSGHVVGQVMVTREWSDWRCGYFWWLQSVYVDPRARRQGVFRKLYLHVRKLAGQQADCCGLRLYVESENDRAQQTYRQLGMNKTGYLVMEETGSGLVSENEA